MPLSLLWLGLVAATAPRPGLPANLAVPLHEGVVFFCPDDTAKALDELAKLKAQGFSLIEFASWAWTLPRPGSALEKRARAVLDWCDHNGVAFFLMHNIQYGSVGEGGGLDRQVLHPAEALPLLTDWARVLKSHPSVMGVILGNEVGPSLGTPKDAPRLWADFRAWLAARYRSVAALNRAWRTSYAGFADVGRPADDSPGWVDYRRYADERFASFYGYLFRHGLRPALGDKLYGCKASLDPYLNHAFRGATMTCWDDMVAQYPLWRIKCAADTTGKPMFNSELHLYNDGYFYGPSVARSRYRYFSGALLGEYLTASFAWGQWSKPAIAAIASATPKILADVGRVQGYCRVLAKACQRGDIGALVTESNYELPQGSNFTDFEATQPLALLYAHLGALGRPWRYVLDDHVASFRGRVLVVWSRGLRRQVARAIVALPASVRVLAVGQVPAADEYGLPLPADLRAALARRMKVVSLGALDAAVRSAPGLPDEYRKLGKASYLWWSPKRGSYQYDEPICRLEARAAPVGEDRVVAVINNTEKTLSAPLPWAEGERVKDLITGAELSAGETRKQDFGPLAIRLFLYR